MSNVSCGWSKKKDMNMSTSRVLDIFLDVITKFIFFVLIHISVNTHDIVHVAVVLLLSNSELKLKTHNKTEKVVV